MHDKVKLGRKSFNLPFSVAACAQRDEAKKSTEEKKFLNRRAVRELFICVIYYFSMIYKFDTDKALLHDQLKYAIHYYA